MALVGLTVALILTYTARGLAPVECKSIDELISEIFGENPGSSVLPDPTRDPFNDISLDDPYPSIITKQGESTCICVPFYLCQNDTLNTDGTGLLDIK